MFFSKKNSQNNSTESVSEPTVSDESLESLATMLVGEEILCEMYKSEALDCDNLDYSLESLKLIDSYLEKVRIDPPVGDDLGRVVLRTGAYIGEVIRRHSAKKTHWLDFEEAAKVSPLVGQIGRQTGTMAMLWTIPAAITFPLAKVQKYLQNGPEDSTYFFAHGMIQELNKS